MQGFHGAVSRARGEGRRVAFEPAGTGDLRAGWVEVPGTYTLVVLGDGDDDVGADLRDGHRQRDRQAAWDVEGGDDLP